MRLLNLIAKIIWNPHDSNKGLPIGNMTSQFFANIYMDPFDHFVKQELKQKRYLRYMDDFAIFTSDKHIISSLLNQMREYLKKSLGLELKKKGLIINTRMHGLSFLGVRIFPSTIRLQKRNLSRCLRKAKMREKEYLEGKISNKKFIQSVDSIFAYMAQFDTLALRQKVMGNRLMVYNR